MGWWLLGPVWVRRQCEPGRPDAGRNRERDAQRAGGLDGVAVGLDGYELGALSARVGFVDAVNRGYDLDQVLIDWPVDELDLVELALGPDLSVDGTVELERLVDVLYVGRPAYGQANSLVGLFKVVEGGNAAVRVTVRLGRSSVNTIEIIEGLLEGDEVILSDMSAYDQYDRVRLR